ncbi:MAG TPA: hypothetical protein VHU88_02800 [Sporichthyaceae bacterium]|jgi:hypothetical protein|nr:hypothetical protein [Sporichthyaceae bacterium]
MQTVYATHLPLPADLGAAALDQAVAAVAGWLHDRYEVSPSPLSGGSHRSDEVTIEWESLFGEAGGLVWFEVDQADPVDATWRWRSHLDIGVEKGQAWIRVRVGLFSPREGLVTRPKVAAHRPPVVRRIADRIDVRIDGRRVGEPWVLTVPEVPSYVKFLTSRERRLPVLAISHDPDGEPFLDRARAADRLLGLAHVVEVDLHSGYAVTDAIGKTLSCYSGAVRMYWPGFAVGDDPYFHRAYVGGSLAYLGREGMGTELFDTLGRLSALSISEPTLRARLRREQHAHETAARAAQAAVTRATLARPDGSPDGVVDRAAWLALCADHDLQQQRLAVLDGELFEARLEIDVLRGERDSAQAHAASLDRALTVASARTPPRRPELESATDEPTPESVLEAVRIAQERCTHLVFLDEAFTAAAVSEYHDPERVLANLLLMEQIGAEWASGELPGGPDDAFKQRCSGYHAGLHEAQVPMADLFRRTFQDREVTLGPHIARGHGSPASVLRIYWYVDVTRKQILIGHVGGLVRTADAVADRRPVSS